MPDPLTARSPGGNDVPGTVPEALQRWTVREQAWGPGEPPPVTITVGPWQLELRGDELCDLTFDGALVVRSVRAVARDHEWSTVPTTVESLTVRDDGCDLDLTMRGLGADIGASLAVRATATTLDVRLAATSRTDFRSNRLGLTVLHPPAVSGTELLVGTVDGRKRRSFFPSSVAPHQPATDIRTLSWTYAGVATTLTFAGDVFEMEDQRNWTDASYKTYSTPLSLPFPVTVPVGETVAQSVCVRAGRVGPRERPTVASRVVELREAGFGIPAVMLGASTVPDEEFLPADLPRGVVGVLVELDLRTPSWRAALSRAAAEAAGRELDVRLTAVDPASVDAAVRAAASAGAVCRIGVFSARTHVTEPDVADALGEAVRRHLPGTELVGGARSHFTELNRRHGRLPADLAALTFPMTPQMHATERAQLVESVAVQATVAADAARIAAGRPLHVGPITLRPRYNAVAPGPPTPGPRTLTAGYGPALDPWATDPRQRSRAMAAWAAGSFAAICAGASGAGGRVATITYFETVGPRGLRDGDVVFPVARAVGRVASLSGESLLVPAEAPPEGVWVVGGALPGGSWRVVAASLADHAASFSVRHGGRTVEVTLPPYGLVTLDQPAP